MKNNEAIDPEIKYWASLCESATTDREDGQEIDESYEQPYLYDISDGDPEILTVGDLKKVLANFKDKDRLMILGEGNREFSIKAMWNANEEYVMTDNDVGDDACLIRID